MSLSSRPSITVAAAKRDCLHRLRQAGITCQRLTGTTRSFEGFGFGPAVFLTIDGAHFPPPLTLQDFQRTLPKPSEGGYLVRLSSSVSSPRPSHDPQEPVCPASNLSSPV